MSDASPHFTLVEPFRRLVRLEDVAKSDALVPLACSALALEFLQLAAGEDHALASFTFNLGSVPEDCPDKVGAAAWVDRRTRTLAFCQMRVMANGELLFAARGLFSRRV